MKKKLPIIILLLLSATLALAQNRIISGQILDDKGEPIAYASIKIKNSNIGVAADINGNFSLEVKANVVLIISATGSQNKEVIIDNEKLIYNIILIRNDLELTNVVVSALGVKRSVRSTPYAVQSLSSSRLTQTRQTDLTTALAGKIAGLQVLGQSEAKLGTPGVIRLRGVGSLSDANAIYVVDGTILDRVTDINMDDIESINVLKGRSATVLYGGRAGAGVIIITSKKGKRNKNTPLSVELNQTTTFDKVANLPNFQDQYMGGGEANWRTFTYNPAAHPADWKVFNGKKYPDYTDDGSWGPKIDGTEYIPWYAWFPGSKYAFQTTTATPQPNNIKNFYDIGITANNNLILSKSWKNISTRVSYTYLTKNGIIPYSWQNKHLLSTQNRWDITSKLAVSTDLNYTNEKIRGNLEDYFGNQTSGSFNSWFHRDVNTKILKELVDFTTPAGYLVSWNHGNPSASANYQTGSINRANFWYNHYSFLKYIKNDFYVTRLFGNITVKYNIIKDLNISASYRFNNRKSSNEIRTPNIIATSAFQTGQLNKFENNNKRYFEQNAEVLITYKKAFNNFTLDALAGYNYLVYTQRDSLRSTSGGLIIRDDYRIDNSAGPAILSAVYGDKKIRSVFGRLTVGYKDFLFLDVAARQDRSSWLPVANNAFIYPSVGVSYIFSDQLQKVFPFLSYGKIRLSSATTGEDVMLGSYAINPTYITLNVPYLTYSGSTVPDAIVDPTIKPALTTEYEAGIETRFWNDRIGLNITVFKENRKNEIVTTNVSTASGFFYNTFNAGKMNRKGIEIQLDVKPIYTKKISWDLSFNWSTYESYVEKISDQTKSIALAGGVAPQFSGVFLPAVYATEDENWGQLRGIGIKKINGIPILRNDGTYIPENNMNFGSILPNYLGGVFNQFRYKDWTLSVNLDFKQGGKYFSVSDFFGGYSGLLAKTAATNDKGKNVRDPLAEGGGVHVYGVKEDGKPFDTYVNAYDYFHQFYNSGGIAELSIFDASYVKLREISIGYNMPVERWGWKNIKKLYISFIARNPWLIYATNRDFDPSETTSLFGEAAQLPGTQSFGVNFKFGF